MSLPYKAQCARHEAPSFVLFLLFFSIYQFIYAVGTVNAIILVKTLIGLAIIVLKVLKNNVLANNRR